MSKLTDQWIDVFASGKHRESEDAFTDADLDQIVSNYDPAHHEAPVVIGHPKSNGPAFAWVSAVRRVGNVLQAQFKQAVPAFEEAVEAGRYKKRSVSLYKSAKGWALRHVGFLGAQPPQVKGLADIQFEHEDEEAIEIEFSEETCMAMDEKDQQSLVEKFTAALAKLLPSAPKTAETQAFSEEAQAAAIKAAVDAAVKPLHESLAAQQKTFSESQTAAQSAASKSRAEQAIAKLKASGKYVPAYDVLGLPSVFAELAKIETTVEFGEGEKKKTITPLQVLVEFLEAQEKIVPTKREVQAGSGKTGTARTYAEGVDQNSIQFSELVEALEAKEGISFSEASRRVAREHPELTVPGNSTSGVV